MWYIRLKVLYRIKSQKNPQFGIRECWQHTRSLSCKYTLAHPLMIIYFNSNQLFSRAHFILYAYILARRSPALHCVDYSQIDTFLINIFHSPYLRTLRLNFLSDANWVLQFLYFISFSFDAAPWRINDAINAARIMFSNYLNIIFNNYSHFLIHQMIFIIFVKV